jgi:hypothetical protein
VEGGSVRRIAIMHITMELMLRVPIYVPHLGRGFAHKERPSPHPVYLQSKF